MGDVSEIRNLGPASVESFAKAGITSAEQLRNIGAKEAYRRLIASGTKPHFIGYYALIMGLQGRPWNDCQGDEKTALRIEFDALKKAAAPKSRGRIEKILDEIGVRSVGD